MRRILAFAVFAAAIRGQESQLLTSFEDDAQLRLLSPRDTKIEVVTNGVTDGDAALLIRFAPVRWPALFFRPQESWNLKRWGELVLDVTNPESEPITFSVRVDDDFRADGTNYCRTGSGTLQPGERQTFAFPLNVARAMDYGMRGLPVWNETRSLGSNGSWPLDTSHIVQFQIFLNGPPKERSLIVDYVRFREGRSLEGIVDQYGQYTGADWPGKLRSDEAFASRRMEESATIPELAGRDAFGGWQDGPRLEAGGFFRTAKVEGRWWFVTPDGSLFFSTGFNATRPSHPTFITGRESMFTWVPAPGDLLARYYGRATSSQGPVSSGVTYDFHSANLNRKYGDDWMERWREITIGRHRAWGFNTIANWSESSLRGRGVPYVTTTHYSGNFAWLTIGSNGIGDPFDARFAAAVRAQVARDFQGVVGDPWCVGHFVDNELPWGSGSTDASHFQIPLAVLARRQGPFPSREFLLDRLRAKYADIAALNSAWGTAFAGWDAVDSPKAPFSVSARADLSALLSVFARRYFEVVRDAVKSADPDHLYLGARFSSYSREVADAAAEYSDVVSFNIYQRRVEPGGWSWVNELDKPCLIGEFHFGALDRGMFHTGLVAARDQDERAAMYRDYLRSVLEHPAFIGAHWFQYVDEPLTGRTLDGENYNIGFTTATDTPYPEMVDAARAIHREMYEIRRGRE